MRNLIAVLVMATAVTVLPAVATAQRMEPTSPAWANRPCKTEDSTNCRWIAPDQGSHGGHSFITHTLKDGTTCIFFTARRYAIRHDRCTK